MAFGAMGFTAGFIMGVGNSMVQGNSLKNSWKPGLIWGGYGAAAGIAAGTVSGGISARSIGADFGAGQSMITPIERGVYNTTIMAAQQGFDVSRYRSVIRPLYQSSEFYFDGQSLYLIDNYSSGQQTLRYSYQATSGSSRYAPIPESDIYTITNINTNYYSNPSYIRDGIGFYADIEPYRLPNGRFGFEIHPDGAINGNWWINNGTGGCIGIQENAANLIQLRDFISSYLSRHENIPLTVNY